MHIDSLVQRVDTGLWAAVYIYKPHAFSSHSQSLLNQKAWHLLKEKPPHLLKPFIKCFDTSITVDITFTLKQSHLWMLHLLGGLRKSA